MTAEEIKTKFGYDFVGEFHEGFARVKKGTRWFHIRPDGEPLYKEKWDSISNFHCGVAMVVEDGNEILINSTGDVLPEGIL
jgi:hypothetical protein